MRLLSLVGAQRTYVTGSKGSLGLRYNESHCGINKFNVGRGVLHRLGNQVWGVNSWPDEVLRFKVCLLSCCSCWYLVLERRRVVFGKVRRWI